MQLIKQYESPEGIFSYREENNKIHLTGYEGAAVQLRIPDKINGYPVSVIGKKAFLGNRLLRYVIVPDTIERIEDWAFARCHALQKIELPERELFLGTQIFQKDEKLYEISLPGCESSVARLMAAAAIMLEAEYLIWPMQAGCDKWYQSFDTRLLTVLSESEEDALKDLVYCAEEDMCGKQDACIRKQSYKKARIALLRLSYPQGMSGEMLQYLTAYVKQRTKGCCDESAWQVIKEETVDQFVYCNRLLAIGGIKEQNIKDILDDLDERHIELKAYLLKKWQEQKVPVTAQTAIWDSLKFE